MPDAPQNPERFKPAMPRIPGVDDLPSESEDAGAAVRWKTTARIAAPVVAALMLGAVIGWWMLRAPGPDARAPAATVQAPQVSPPNPLPPNSVPESPVVLPDGSVEVATIQELARPWSSKKFLFRKRFTSESVPALVMRLPGGAANQSASYWAFSLQAPFSHCELELVTDIDKLASQYGYRARHPMVGDPCNGTVYDPLRLGTLIGGAWARGEVVQGSGVRPPIAIEVRVQGNHLVASRIE